MNKDSSIFVAGHRGMVGSALTRVLTGAGFGHLILKDREELDLTSQDAVATFFQESRPEYVFLSAARVGGIHANNAYPAEFIRDNLAIQTNVIHAARESGVRRLLFLGSSCIYPKLAPQPMREEHLLAGPLEPTNEPYAIAKIAGIKMCEAYNRQYGTEFIAAMPTNLYGPEDNFHLDNSHVLPALIRRFHEAKLSGDSEVVVWGSGTPRREFLHVDDMARACLSLMEMETNTLKPYLLSYPEPCFVNVGSGVDIAIGELASMIAEVVGFNGKLVFDPSKPDGTPRKLLDVSRLKQLGWQSTIDLHSGIEQTYQWFLDNQDP